MAKKSAVPQSPSPFERLCRRVQAEITSPRARLERRANIARLDHEPEEAWQALLEQIEETEGVRLIRRDDGSVHVTWTDRLEA
ncbi:hypothetical protein D3C84_587420 [compost metagenome]